MLVIIMITVVIIIIIVSKFLFHNAGTSFYILCTKENYHND